MSKWGLELYKKLHPEEYARMYGKKAGGASVRKTKYGNKRTGKGAEGYDSLLEERVGSDLYLREKAGEISNIRRQVTVVLQEGSNKERIAVKIDFVAFDETAKKDFAIEAKGCSTPRWSLCLKLWRVLKPMKLEIWGGTHKSPRLIETVG